MIFKMIPVVFCNLSAQKYLVKTKKEKGSYIICCCDEDGLQEAVMKARL